MKVRIRKRHAVFAALVVALSIPAAGSSRSSGLPTQVGAGEGKLTMVAWEGYAQDRVGEAVPEADRLHRPAQVRRLVRRDG